MHQDPFAMGADAGRMALEAIAGEPIEPAFIQPDAPLVLRETTALLPRPCLRRGDRARCTASHLCPQCLFCVD